MLTARGKGRLRLRCPNNQRSSGETSGTNSSSSPPRRGDSFLPGQGFISGLGDMSSRRACYLGNFDRSTQNLESQISFVMMSNDKKYCNWLAWPNKKQRVTKNKVVGCKPESGFVENHFGFCWKWLILLKLITIRVLTNQNISKILSLLFHIPFNNYTSCL